MPLVAPILLTFAVFLSIVKSTCDPILDTYSILPICAIENGLAKSLATVDTCHALGLVALPEESSGSHDNASSSKRGVKKL